MRRFLFSGLVAIAAAALFSGCSSESSSGGGDSEELPDLRFFVMQSGSAASVEAGQPVAIQYSIENTADGGSMEESSKMPAAPAAGPDAGPFDVLFFFSTDDIFDPDNDTAMLPLLEVDGLDAGSSTMMTDWVIDIPAEMPPGSYYVFGGIDCYDEVEESDETNNIDSFMGVTVTAPADGLPDLTSNFGGYQSVMTQGTQTTITAGITNLGPVASPLTCEVLCYISENSAFDPGDELLDMSSVTVPVLATGEQIRMEFTFTVPGTYLGNVYIFGIIDVDEVITESSENNNYFQCGVEIVPPPV